MAETEDMQVPTECGDVHVRVYRPRTGSEPQPALVYLHGGGWTMFSIDTHERIMRELAARAGVVVVGVDYALSPEAKFPFALRQIEGVVRWLASHADEFEIDPKRLAIGGDSAGANLAVGTSLILRDAGEPEMLKGMLLLYGCFTNVLSETSANGYGAEGNLLTSSEMAGFWKNYLADPADALDPLASPLLAQLEGLPQTFQVIAQCDVLAEQNVAFAKRLREAGVAVEKQEYAGATHSFLEAVSIADVAGRALDDSAAWLRKCLRVSA
jgi:acetyl esterase